MSDLYVSEEHAIRLKGIGFYESCIPNYQRVFDWFEDTYKLFSEQSNILSDFSVSRVLEDGEVELLKSLETYHNYISRSELREVRLEWLISWVENYNKEKENE